MKNYIFIVLFLCLCISCITIPERTISQSRQNQVLTFNKITPGSYLLNSCGYSVLPATDGNLIICGTTMTYSFDCEEGLILKAYTNGDYLWARTFSGIDNSCGQCRYIKQIKDGLVLVGTAKFNKDRGDDIALIKIDNEGNTVWSKNFGSNGDDYGYSMELTSDNGYIIAGSTNQPSNLFYLVKTDDSGNLIWEKTFGQTGSAATAYSVKQTKDKGFIIAGDIVVSNTPNSADVYIVKIDENGNSLWAKTFNINAADSANSLLQTSDGEYMVCGTSGDKKYF